MIYLRLTSILSLVFLCFGLKGQTLQSVQHGNWDQPSTWMNGVVPDHTTESVVVHHSLKIPNGVSVSINGLTIAPTGMLEVENGGSLHISDTPDAVVVSGSLQSNEGSIINNSDPGNIVFEDGATYIHNFTSSEGLIPLASWSPGSTTRIAGYTTTAGFESINWSQRFGNFVWDCPQQSGIINLNGLLNNEIQGSFLIENTGSSLLRLSSGENFKLTVAQNLEIKNSARLQCTLSGNAELEVGGDFIFESLDINGSRTNTTGQTIIDVKGNFLMDAPDGILSLGAGSGSGTGVLRVAGDFSLVNGTIHETGSGNTQGRIEFVGNGEFDFISSGNLTGSLQYYVGPETNINLTTSQFIGNANSSLEVDGIIRVGSVDPQGAIILGSGNGAGNIRVADRIFNSGSAVIYNGNSAQTIGNGHPADDGVDMIIQNPTGVYFNANSNLSELRIGGSLIMEAGSLHVDSNPSQKNLHLSGPLVTHGNSLSFSGNQSDLIIDGSGTLDVIPVSGDLVFRNLTMNRVGESLIIPDAVHVAEITTINGGSLIVNGETIVNQLNITEGTLELNGNTVVKGPAAITGGILSFDDVELTIENQLNVAGGLLQSGQNSELRFTGTGIIGSLAFTPNSQLRTIYLNRLMGGVLATLTTPIRVTESVNLVNGLIQNDGIFELDPGATITTSNISGVNGNPLTGGPYHVVYTGTANISPTGAELPLNEPLASLTSMSSASVLLGSDVEILEDIVITSGTLNLNGHDVSCTNIQNDGTVVAGAGILRVNGDVLNNGVFHAPTSSGLFQLEGNFENNGTFNQVGGTLEFIGSSQFNGNVPDFRNIIVSDEFYAPPEFYIRGNFTNNGDFHHQNGKVIFSGTTLTPQEISGSSPTTFNHVNISNTTANPGVQVESDISLAGVLTLEPGVRFDPDGLDNKYEFALLSSADDPTRDASIGILPDNAIITGEITIQRYMRIEGANNNRIYRYISSPVANASVEDLQNEIPVTGNFNGTSLCMGCSTNPSMFEYEEAITLDLNGNGTADLEDGYQPFPVEENSEQLTTGKGYAVFVRGNILEAPVWDVKGNINRGEIDFPVTFTASGNSEYDGWNLVGNPYPSTIDFDAPTGWTKTNIDGAIYFRDNGNIPERIATWNGETGINGGSGFISTGQGFWVKANGPDPVLKANENVKVPGISSTFFRQEDIEDLLRIRLVTENSTDETIIYFREGASADFDTAYDAFKLKNGSVNLASFPEGGNLLAINAQAPFNCETRIDLSVTELQKGRHKLEFEGIESFDDDVTIRLLDQYMDEEYDLRKNQFVFFTINENPESGNSNRFSLALKVMTEDPSIVLVDSVVCESADVRMDFSINETYEYSIVHDALQLNINPVISDSTLIFSTNDFYAGINKLRLEIESPSCQSLLSIPFEIAVALRPMIDSVLNDSICNAGEAVLHAGSETADLLNWYDCLRCQVPVQSGGSIFLANINETSTFYVEPISDFGCTGERVPVVATLVPFKPAEIQVTNDSMVSNHVTGNRWYYNEVFMDSSRTIAPDETGVYTLEVHQGICSSSDSVYYKANSSLELIVFPNPVSDVLTITGTSGKEEYLVAVVMDLNGRELLRGNGKGIILLDMHRLASGYYWLRIGAERGSRVFIIRRK